MKRGQTNTHTDTHTDIATTRSNRPSGPIWWKISQLRINLPHFSETESVALTFAFLDMWQVTDDRSDLTYNSWNLTGEYDTWHLTHNTYKRHMTHDCGLGQWFWLLPFTVIEAYRLSHVRKAKKLYEFKLINNTIYTNDTSRNLSFYSVCLQSKVRKTSNLAEFIEWHMGASHNQCYFQVNTHTHTHMGQFSQDGNWSWVMSSFKKVLKLAVTKHEERPLFFQLFMRIFFSFNTRKNIQVTLTPLHYTTLHWSITLYTTLQ